jgi:hypothetical protein
MISTVNLVPLITGFPTMILGSITIRVNNISAFISQPPAGLSLFSRWSRLSGLSGLFSILRARDAILFYAFYRFIYILFSFNMIFQFNNDLTDGHWLPAEMQLCVWIKSNSFISTINLHCKA